MGEMQVFNSEQFGQVRTITIEGEPWFVVSDVCDYFGVSNRNRIMQQIDEDEKGGTQIDTPGGKQTVTIINESGLYNLLFLLQPTKARGVSDEYIVERQEKIKRFKRWVTHEVLPSIRKTGGYIMGEEKMSDEELLASAVIMANRKLEERAARIKALEDEKARLIETNAFQAEQIEEMAPKASYCDRILASKDLVPITQIAKDYGMSAIEMNRFLHEHGYQYRRNKTWVLYDKYAGFGYTSSKTHLYEDKGGREHSQMSTQWTQAGRLFLYEELKKFEILPMVERGLI